MAPCTSPTTNPSSGLPRGRLRSDRVAPCTSPTTKFSPARGLAICPCSTLVHVPSLRALVIRSELSHFRETNAHAREWNAVHAAHALVFYFSFSLLLYIRTRTRVSFFIFPSIYSQHTHGILLLPIRPFWSSSGTLKVRPGGTLDHQVSSCTWASSLPCVPLSCMGRPAPRLARTRDLFGTLLLP